MTCRDCGTTVCVCVCHIVTRPEQRLYAGFTLHLSALSQHMSCFAAAIVHAACIVGLTVIVTAGGTCKCA